MSGYQTKQRTELLAYLARHSEERISAQKIAKDLPHVSLSAVYRNLVTLEKEGKISRCVNTEGRETSYRFAHSEACLGHLHLSCRKCGHLYHLDDKQSRQLIDSINATQSFCVDPADTVLYGVCAQCRGR